MLIVSNSAKLEKAVALNEHGYSEAARLELIDLIYGPTSSLMLDTDKKIAALHLLGQISLENDELSGALDAWNLLVEEFPKSQLAESVQEKMVAVEVAFERQLSDLTNTVEATRYLSIADNWLKAAEYEAPTLDSSFVPHEQAALDWFYLTIERFPSTSHAELAYEKLIEVRLGRTRTRVFGRAQQAQDAELSEEIFGDFESAFPHSDKLQRLRYLIGQKILVGWRIREG